MRYKLDPTKFRESNKRSAQKHKKKRRAYQKKWCKRNQERLTIYSRTYKLKEYGMTLTDYEILYAKQQGKCAICEGSSNGKGRLHVDHDHISNRVRGLLCFDCNSAIGKLRDDPELLYKAISYLEGQ